MAVMYNLSLRVKYVSDDPSKPDKCYPSREVCENSVQAIRLPVIITISNSNLAYGFIECLLCTRFSAGQCNTEIKKVASLSRRTLQSGEEGRRGSDYN